MLKKAWKWSWLIFTMLSYPPPANQHVHTHTHTHTSRLMVTTISMWRDQPRPNHAQTNSLKSFWAILENFENFSQLDHLQGGGGNSTVLKKWKFLEMASKASWWILVMVKLPPPLLWQLNQKSPHTHTETDGDNNKHASWRAGPRAWKHKNVPKMIKNNPGEKNWINIWGE